MTGRASSCGIPIRMAVIGAAVAAMFALFSALTGCEREPAAQRPTARAEAAADASGPPRIVSLSPAISIILDDLGRANEVVGRHAWEMVLDPSLPVCGDQSGLDYERLLSVRPTHVLTQWGSRDLPARLATLAAERGWTVEDYTILSLAEIRSAVAQLDRIARDLPAGEQSERGRELLTAMDEAWSQRGADLAPAGRVLLLISASPASALGPGSWHHEILTAIGGTPAISQGAAYISLDREDLLRLSPDAVVMIMPRPVGDVVDASGTPAIDPSIARAIQTLGEMGVARPARIAVIDDPLALTPSTAMIDFANDLRAVLSGWAEEGTAAPAATPMGTPAATPGAP